jgi:hypothetical protein
MSKGSLSIRAGRPSELNKQSATLASLADKTLTVRINFDLDREYHTKLKIFAAKQEKTIKELLIEHIITLVS